MARCSLHNWSSRWTDVCPDCEAEHREALDYITSRSAEADVDAVRAAFALTDVDDTDYIAVEPYDVTRTITYKRDGLEISISHNLHETHGRVHIFDNEIADVVDDDFEEVLSDLAGDFRTWLRDTRIDAFARASG